MDRADQADQATCRRQALDLLARREHTALELEHKLTARGYDETVIGPTLRALEREGLIDSTRFAEAFVRARTGKGQGPVRIRAELRQRGVAELECERALDAEDWIALARRVRAKKFGDRDARSHEDRMRQSRFLQYRGFTQEQIRRALDAAGQSD